MLRQIGILALSVAGLILVHAAYSQFPSEWLRDVMFAREQVDRFAKRHGAYPLALDDVITSSAGFADLRRLCAAYSSDGSSYTIALSPTVHVPSSHPIALPIAQQRLAAYDTRDRDIRRTGAYMYNPQLGFSCTGTFDQSAIAAMNAFVKEGIAVDVMTTGDLVTSVTCVEVDPEAIVHAFEVFNAPTSLDRIVGVAHVHAMTLLLCNTRDSWQHFFDIADVAPLGWQIRFLVMAQAVLELKAECHATWEQADCVYCVQRILGVILNIVQEKTCALGSRDGQQVGGLVTRNIGLVLRDYSGLSTETLGGIVDNVIGTSCTTSETTQCLQVLREWCVSGTGPDFSLEEQPDNKVLLADFSTCAGIIEDFGADQGFYPSTLEQVHDPILEEISARRLLKYESDCSSYTLRPADGREKCALVRVASKKYDRNAAAERARRWVDEQFNHR